MTNGNYFRPRLVLFPGHSRPDGRLDARRKADRFRETMLQHLDAAYSYARFLTRSETVAEDIVQDAFLRAFRSFDGWRGDNGKAWLLAIVRNCFHDTVGGRTDPLRGAEPVEAIDASGAGIPLDQRPDTLAEQNSDVAMLRRTIEDLPEPFREALVLRELDERNYKEIAAITKVPIGTVMSRLARARTMLAALLLPDEGQQKEARS